MKSDQDPVKILEKSKPISKPEPKAKVEKSRPDPSKMSKDEIREVI